MTARYAVCVDHKTIYTGSSFRRARSVFEGLPTAELFVDGYRIALRLNGERFRALPERVTCQA